MPEANDLSRPTVAIVIPTKNEIATIERIARESKQYADEVVIIDANSTYGTPEAAVAAGARVLLDEGRGKGMALRQALRDVEADIIVFMDADGSHDPADVPKLVAPILADEADMVIGDRMRGGSDELHGNFHLFIRLMATELITLTINSRWHSHLFDIQNGFRALKRDMGLNLGLRERGFSIEQEMVMKGLQRGYRIINVPSHEYERFAGASRINLWTEWVAYGWSILKHLPRRRVRR